MSQGSVVLIGENSASIAVPRDGYANVASLVIAGFVASRGLSFEVVDDIQLAVDLIFHSIPASGSHLTVELASRKDELTVSIGPFDMNSLTQRLGEVIRDGLDLGTVLGRLVDSIEVVESRASSLVLHKKFEAPSF